MDRFDYNAPAELYPGRNRKSAKKFSYRRFETAADAIRFAVEELPELLLLGACIEINEQRLNYKDIQALYASEQYPLEKGASREYKEASSGMKEPTVEQPANTDTTQAKKSVSQHHSVRGLCSRDRRKVSNRNSRLRKRR